MKNPQQYPNKKLVELILLKTYGEMGDKVLDWMD